MADSTKAMRKSIVDQDIQPAFENRRLNEITADDLRALCNKVKARGAPATAVHSGRYAMLDDGMGFSLVTWKPVIEQRLGQQIAATVRGPGASWEIGRQRGPSVG